MKQRAPLFNMNNFFIRWKEFLCTFENKSGGNFCFTTLEKSVYGCYEFGYKYFSVWYEVAREGKNSRQMNGENRKRNNNINEINKTHTKLCWQSNYISITTPFFCGHQRPPTKPRATRYSKKNDREREKCVHGRQSQSINKEGKCLAISVPCFIVVWRLFVCGWASELV